MISTFVKRPAMTVMFVMVFVVLGIVSSFNLIIEQTPRLEFPLVSVNVRYNGASPEEIESQMIKKVEDAVSEISQMKKIESESYEGFGFIMIEFEMGSDVNIKAIEVKDKVDAVANEFPQAADKPVISKFDPLIQPIVDLVLIGDTVDDRTLFEYADKKLRDKLNAIGGVASVDVYGGKERQINIYLDPMLMKKYYTSIEDVIASLGARNVNKPGGSIERYDSKQTVRLIGEFESVEDIRNLSLVSREGRKILLSDIATIRDSHKKVETYTRFNGKSAVGLSVKKLSDGDAVSIVRRIFKDLPKLRKDLPEGMELIVAYDSTTFILDDTAATVKNIIYGVLLTIIILFVFLADIRVTFIAAIVIPSSIMSAFFLMDFSGFTINFITLLAIATSLGTLIANALVVIESVEQELQEGKDAKTAAVEGTKEAAVAVFSSAGTNLVVFTPIAFMGGIVGQFMKQFGLTVVYATIFSILASFSLTPMLCGLLLKQKKKNELEKGKSFLDKLEDLSRRANSYLVSEYKYIFDFNIHHPFLTILFCVLLLLGGIYPAKYIGNEFFSPSDEDKIGITVELPQGSPLERTLDVVKDIEKLVIDLPEAKNCLSYVGIDGSENATITLSLKPSRERERSDLDIINSLIPEVAKIPGAFIALNRGGMGPGEADIAINVAGIDYDTIISISNQMIGIMEDTGYFRSVESSYKVPKDEIRFIPDDEKMMQYGVFNAQVGDLVRDAIQGNDRNVYKEKGEEYTINVELDPHYKQTPEDVGEITVTSKDGLVTLSQLGKVVKSRGYSTIKRRDKVRVIQINGYLSKSTAGQVQVLLDKKFKQIKFPEGYGYKYAGHAEFQEETFREIFKAFLLAVILTYMLLVAIMNSFTYPFVIVSSIATSMLGVILCLFFFEFSINIGSMMAIVMLVGLVVNNAILMLDFALRRIEKGMDTVKALWMGASYKFRAILMTSLAIVFGAIPQVFDIFVAKASIGAVIVGGVLASIFFTFVLIPAIFLLASRIQSFMLGKIKSKL
ncbi:MAG: efflux RND transporter permease subunit [Endomicrobiales bacterium]|nr:efflux RND transporter permease subunit [Endomicrobiales bacterium]